ncbi:diiron oxygenase [Actinocorallia lasiicapitis]
MVLTEENGVLETEEREYRRALDRLSKASVRKNWQPYRDIAWDDPGFAIDPDDPRWILPASDPLGSHAWYLAQSPELRARIGLYRQANVARVGMQFENILNRGLLSYALRLPNGSAEFRYVYHEMIEEGHHGMMFQEFVNRSGTEVPGLSRWARWFGEVAQLTAVAFPTLYFFGVIAGEEPIDHMQRTILRDASSGHPLLNKIMQIHVAEEARHISFGHQYLRFHVPRMLAPSRFVLSVAVPPLVFAMARVILGPPPAFAATFGIPAEVVKRAYWGAAESRGLLTRATSGLYGLADEIGLLNPVSRRLWRAFGLAENTAAHPLPPSGK